MTANLPMKSKTLMPALPLDAKLTALLLGSDYPVVGPKTAAALAQFIEQPGPDLPTEAQVEVMIGKLAIGTAQARVSEAEAEARFELYWLALKDLPLCDLRTAFVELVKHNKFLPVPAEVRTAAMKAGRIRDKAKFRARQLLFKHQTEWEPPRDYLPPSEARALLSSINVSMG